MSAIQHVSFADKLINATRTRRLWVYLAIFPTRKIVALQIGERSVAVRGDELIHSRVIEVVADELKLLFRISPPQNNVRFAEPTANERQICGRHRTKLRHAGLYGQVLSTSQS